MGVGARVAVGTAPALATAALETAAVAAGTAGTAGAVRAALDSSDKAAVARREDMNAVKSVVMSNVDSFGEPTAKLLCK